MARTIPAAIILLQVLGISMGALAQGRGEAGPGDIQDEELDALRRSEDATAAELRRLLEILKTAKPAPMPPLGRPSTEDAFREDNRGTVEHDPATGETRRSPASPGDPLRDRERSSPPRAPADLFDGTKGLFVPRLDSEAAIPSATPPSPLLNTTTFPFQTVVKLLMRFRVSGIDYFYVCSAETIRSFHLLSAGHCVYNFDPNGDGSTSDARWANEVWAWAAQTDRVDPFATPDFPYGVAKVVWMRSYTGWVNSGLFDHDWAVLTLDRRLGDHTGWMGIETGVNTSSLNFSGYPAETPFVPAGELRQYPGFDSNNVLGYTSGRIRMDAFTYGGHSGGPVWRFFESDRFIQGINSTSNRAGYAEATLITNGKFNDMFSWVADDETVRPPTDRPDLIEYWFSTTAKDLLTNAAVQGGSISVEYNVLNAGFVNSGSGTTLDFYLSTNDIISTNDTYLGTLTFGSGVEAFTFFNSTTNLTIPNSQSPGNYYVGWIMTATVPEYLSSTNDNTVVIADETVAVQAAPTAPDLIVSSFNLSAGLLEPGQNFTASAVVRNQGDGSSSGTTLRYMRSTNSFISSADTQIGTDGLGSLAPSGTSAESAQLTAPNSEGSWWIGACVDTVSGESNTSNQCSSGVPITVEEKTLDIAVGLNGVAGPDGAAGLGLVWIADGGNGFAHRDWLQVPWGDYSTTQGETRPAWCDVDGDGRHELVIGLGPDTDGGGTVRGGAGFIEVREDGDGGFVHLAWLQLPWGNYQSANGETWPACGDVDDDGRDEIVVGLGQGGGGFFYVYDDAIANYVAHPATPNGAGWVQLGWGNYNVNVGELRPAVGNVDADAAEEIVLGLASGGGGFAQMRDDALNGFAPHGSAPIAGGWIGVPWGTYNGSNGETWPAVCDLNGDGWGEVVLGLGQGSGGFSRILDSLQSFGPPASGTGIGDGGWLQVAWGNYNASVGTSFPTCGLNADAAEELLLGLGSWPGNGGYVEVKDDLMAGLATLAWPQVPFGDYVVNDGLTRPAAAR